MDEPPPRSLPTPHNNLFLFGLAHPSVAAGLIRQMLPGDIVAKLDLTTLQRRSESYIDEELRDSHADVVYSVQSRPGSIERDALIDNERDVLVYFLFEHKSTPDRLTAFQLLKYVVRIWEGCVRERQRLLPVIPLVVYHGEPAWTPSGIAEIAGYPEWLAEFSVQFSFPMLDLWRSESDPVAGDSEQFLQSLLKLLKYGRSIQLLEHLPEIFRHLAPHTDPNLLEGRINAVVLYIMSTNPSIKPDDLQHVIAQTFPTYVYPGTIADKLRKEGREEGLLIGKIQVLEELCQLPVSGVETLSELKIDELQSKLAELQATLRDR